MTIIRYDNRQFARRRSEAGPNAVADRAANAADKILRGEKPADRPSMSGAFFRTILLAPVTRTY
jgi:hypothetical protein